MGQPDPNAQSGTETGQSAGTGEGQDTGTTEATGQSAGMGTETGKPAEETVSRSDFEKQKERMAAADRRASEAEAKLKQLIEKDLPEQEKLKNQLTEVTTRAEKAEESLTAARLELAFLKANKYKWKNPATALKLADLSAVEIDDDGAVRNLDRALDALAKSDPYLLDTDAGGEEEKPKGSTGAPSAGGQSGKSGGNLKAMASRIPALRTRGIGN